MTTGKIYRRKQRILKTLGTPKTFKQVAKELSLSNGQTKKDLLEMMVDRQVNQMNDGKYYVQS